MRLCALMLTGLAASGFGWSGAAYSATATTAKLDLPCMSVTAPAARSHIITATAIAVALGLTPVNNRNPEEVVSNSYGALVGAYTQTIDAHGVIHVRGRHPANGMAYELTIDRAGIVDADIGERQVHFRVRWRSRSKAI